MHTQVAEPGPRAVTVPANSWIPTRKWIAGIVTALAAFLVNWINAGEFTMSHLRAIDADATAVPPAASIAVTTSSASAVWAW